MSLGNGLDDFLSRNHDEDEAKKVQPRYVRNEKGQFLSNTPVAPFGVPRYIDDVEKSWAGSLGGKVGSKASKIGRKHMVKSSESDILSFIQGKGPKLKNTVRYRAGMRIDQAGNAINRSNATREAAGYGIAAGGAAGAAGAVGSLSNKRKRSG